MKKNLRIASAAAAALLAVAPVAASAVNPANADVTLAGGNGNTNTKPSIQDNKVSVNITLNPKVDANGKKLVQGTTATVTATQNGNTLTVGTISADDVKVTPADGTAVDATTTYEAGKQYKVVINNLKLYGLTTSQTNTYSATSGAFSGTGTNDGKVSAAQLSSGVTYTDTLSVTDASIKGTPYYTKKSNSTVIDSDTLQLASATSAKDVNANSAQNILSQINSDYTANGGNDDNKKVSSTGLQDIIAQLNAAGVKTSGTNGDFVAPAGPITLHIATTFANGQQAKLTLNVVAEGSAVTASDAPKFTIANTSSSNLTANGNNVFSYNNNLKLGANFSVKNDILPQLSVLVKAGSTNKISNDDVKVVSNNVNTAVAGKYQVVLEATNPAGKTTRATVNVTVGDPDAPQKTVVSDSDASIYNINGNTPVKSDKTVKTGSVVSTFGTITLDGKEYTRINSKDSNDYILSSDLGDKKPEEKTVSETVMYKSAIYNKDGKTTGKHISGYTDTDFAAGKDGKAEEVTINGSKFLKLAGDKGYVRTRNVFGSEMTLKHNAYAYKSNGRRANRKLYKKGTKITVYGGQYRAIRHYRKNAVRIGHNRYIKVVNVNYKLAD